MLKTVKNVIIKRDVTAEHVRILVTFRILFAQMNKK